MLYEVLGNRLEDQGLEECPETVEIIKEMIKEIEGGIWDILGVDSYYECWRSEETRVLTEIKMYPILEESIEVEGLGEMVIERGGKNKTGFIEVEGEKNIQKVEYAIKERLEYGYTLGVRTYIVNMGKNIYRVVIDRWEWITEVISERAMAEYIRRIKECGLDLAISFPKRDRISIVLLEEDGEDGEEGEEE